MTYDRLPELHTNPRPAVLGREKRNFPGSCQFVNGTIEQFMAYPECMCFRLSVVGKLMTPVHIALSCVIACHHHSHGCAPVREDFQEQRQRYIEEVGPNGHWTLRRACIAHHVRSPH